MTINVCFHGIGSLTIEREPGERSYWVTVDLFEQILDLVVDRPEVRLSFDDGNLSDVEQALPRLVQRGLRADFFVLASRIGAPGSLDAEGIRALSAAGMGIGSHGMDHTPWPGLDDVGVRRELVLAREVIQEVAGQEVTAAACPLGRYDRRVLRSLREYGYTWVGTSDRRHAREDAWLQPRFSVRAADTPSSFRSEVLRMAQGRRASAAARGLLKRFR